MIFLLGDLVKILSQMGHILLSFPTLFVDIYSFFPLSLLLLQSIFNRPGVAGAALQTPLSLINWLTLIESPFPPNLQNIINPKPLELGTWNAYTMFTTFHVSCVTCQVSPVTCHLSPVFFLLQIAGASWWRACYQRGLPRLVSHGFGIFMVFFL